MSEYSADEIVVHKGPDLVTQQSIIMYTHTHSPTEENEKLDHDISIPPNQILCPVKKLIESNYGQNPTTVHTVHKGKISRSIFLHIMSGRRERVYDLIKELNSWTEVISLHVCGKTK